MSTGPPSSDTVRSFEPPTRNPTWRPSGEKNGVPAPSVPAIGVEVSWSCSRIQSRPPRSAGPTYTRRFPSGEIATRFPDCVTGWSACSGGRKRLNRLTAGTGAGRSQPHKAAAMASAAMPTSAKVRGSRRPFPALAATGATAAVRTVGT